MRQLLHDLRIARRSLGKSPGFTLAAIASLAIGIGATTAIFSIVQALLARPLAGIAEPERLVDIGRTQRGLGFDTFGYPDLVDLRQNARSLDQIFGYSIEPYLVRLGEASQRVLGFAVSANYFDALGVHAASGRLLQASDESAGGGAPVVVVSHEFFERQLGADPSKIGQILRIDGRPLTLVGVAPRAFQGNIFGLRPEVYVPLTLPLSRTADPAQLLASRRSTWFLMGGRLAPGSSIAAARTEVAAIAERVADEFPETHAQRGIALLPAGPVPGEGRGPLRLFSLLLFTLVALVLAIACMNVASMLLARGEVRRRELAIRQSLGASRRRLLGERLTETIALFAMAAVPGLLIARWSTMLLARLQPPTPFPVTLDFPVDWRVAAFAFSVALTTGLISGLAPALDAVRGAPSRALHDGGAGSGTRQLRLRRTVVGGQMALSLLLLVAAGLLLRAVRTAQAINPGFRPAGVVAFELDFHLAGYRGESGPSRLDEILERARALPGVEAATAARVLPLDLSRMGLGGVFVDGFESPSKWGFDADANVVAPGFFPALQIPLEGRDFDAGDHAGAQRVAIVNRTFAERFFPAGAIGRTFALGDSDDRQELRIVGVANDIQSDRLGGAARLFLWVPAAQEDLRSISILVRSRDDTATVAREVRALLADLDPDLPPGPPRPLVDVAATSTLPQRLAAAVAGSVGGIGLLLAAVGLYGVVAYAVAARRRELAIRMSLGASGRAILRHVLGDAARPVAGGLVIGLLLSLALSRLLSSLLYGLSPTDLATFVGVPAVLVAVAFFAVLAPARRAVTVDPASALRAE